MAIKEPCKAPSKAMAPKLIFRHATFALNAIACHVRNRNVAASGQGVTMARLYPAARASASAQKISSGRVTA